MRESGNAPDIRAFMPTRQTSNDGRQRSHMEALVFNRAPAPNFTLAGCFSRGSRGTAYSRPSELGVFRETSGPMRVGGIASFICEEDLYPLTPYYQEHLKYVQTRQSVEVELDLYPGQIFKASPRSANWRVWRRPASLADWAANWRRTCEVRASQYRCFP